MRVQRVAGSAGNVGDNVSLLSDQSVDGGGFADVRASYDSDAGQVVRIFHGVFPEVGHHLVQQVACTRTADGGDAEQIAGNPQTVKFLCLIHPVLIVHFICDQVNRFVDIPQQAGEVLIQVGDSDFGIHHEENHVRLLHGEQHLLVDFLFENIIAVGNVSARINDRKIFPVPRRLSVIPVAGHAALFIDNGFPGADKPVEEG